MKKLMILSLAALALSTGLASAGPGCRGGRCGGGRGGLPSRLFHRGQRGGEQEQEQGATYYTNAPGSTGFVPVSTGNCANCPQGTGDIFRIGSMPPMPTPAAMPPVGK